MAINLISICILVSILIYSTQSQTANLVVQLDNVTNEAVDRYAFGMNLWTSNIGTNDMDYTANYTIIRNGGEVQSRFNWEINAVNQCKDYYWISQTEIVTWTEQMDAVVMAGADVFMQIPAMGWVAKNAAKTWSFSQAKYGNQTGNECDKPIEPCNSDAGNGMLTNGSFITGNDPNDANKITTPQDAAAWVTQINDRYGPRAAVYGIDNEPCIWYVSYTHTACDYISFILH